MESLVRATQGENIEGLTILEKIEDALRLCTIYLDGHGDISVGFGGTRNSLYDWLENLEPTREADRLLAPIRHWINAYLPGNIVLVGHSQGAAHALRIAFMLHGFAVSVVTFGGLPVSFNPVCEVVNYLNRRDLMAWVPWWVFGLAYHGTVVKIGKKGWPSPSAHDPAEYMRLMGEIVNKNSAVETACKGPV